MSFGTRLKERREAARLTQKDLGVLLGVSGNAVGNYEKGISSPNADALYRLFPVLGCDANYLFQDEIADLALPSLLQDETELLDIYRSLDADGKRLCQKMMKALLSEHAQKNSAAGTDAITA